MNNWSQQIEDDLRWREEELVSLKLQAISMDKNSIRHKALLRAMWVLLYAHYEGFCKFPWYLYLEELAMKEKTRSKCSPSIWKAKISFSSKSILFM